MKNKIDSIKNLKPESCFRFFNIKNFIPINQEVNFGIQSLSLNVTFLRKNKNNILKI